MQFNWNITDTDAVHPLMIPLQLSGGTSYLVVYFPSMNRSLKFISLQKNHHGTHQQKIIHNLRLICQIIKVRSLSLSQQYRWDVVDVMDYDHFSASLSVQIQVSIVLIGTVQKTISRHYRLGHAIWDNSAEIPEDFWSHNSERVLESPKFLTQTMGKGQTIPCRNPQNS